MGFSFLFLMSVTSCFTSSKSSKKKNQILNTKFQMKKNGIHGI